MRKEIITCDRCDKPFTDGVTSVYITVKGNGAAASEPVNGQDFCHSCLGLIYNAITDTARKVKYEQV